MITFYLFLLLVFVNLVNVHLKLKSAISELVFSESVGQTHSESSGQGGTSQPLTETPAPNGWSSWGSWSDCDLQCRHFRYRLCTNLDAAFCPGSTTETEACAHPCKSKGSFPKKKKKYLSTLKTFCESKSLPLMN